jgi:hypothetical protein
MKALPLIECDAVDAAVTKKVVVAMLADCPMIRRVRVQPSLRLGRKVIAVETTNGEADEAHLATTLALQNLVRYTIRREVVRG